jgi:hypothetical protein
VRLTRTDLAAIALIVAVVTLLVWRVRFDWRECRMVGHSKLYCVIHAGD